MDELPHKSKRSYIAFTIAQEFKDRARLPMYESMCKKYGLTVVLRAFAEAKAMPQSRVRKSRVALFRYLIKKYADQNKQITNRQSGHPGDRRRGF